MPTRRDFLAATSALAATAVAPRLPLRAAETSDASIGLGFSLYGMRSLSVSEAIATCAKIGYDCVELPVQSGWPGDSSNPAENPKRIRAALDEHKIRLSGLMENLHAAVDDQRHQSNLSRLAAAAKFGHLLAPDNPPVIETILGGRPADWDSVKQRMAARLRDWAKVAKSNKTIVAIKAHVGGAMHLPEHPVWLAKQVDSPWIKCAYDYSHFELRGVDMARSVKMLVPHSEFIHVKDSRGDANKVQFLLPGDGRIDYVKLLKLIAAAGYQRDIFVEVSGQIHGKSGYDPVAAAKRCYANLAPAFDKAGIRRS